MKDGKVLFLAFFVLLPISGCFGNPVLEEDDQFCSQPAESGVAISFDDRMNILSWNESIPFLVEHEIIATFYVDRWHLLTDEQISILTELQNLGHEIGIHTMNHSNKIVIAEIDRLSDRCWFLQLSFHCCRLVTCRLSIR